MTWQGSKSRARVGLCSARVVVCACAVLAYAGELSAQAAAASQPEPLVRSVSLRGVKQVRGEDLLRSLATEATRCKGFLLKPFCAITGSGIFTERHKLNRDEVKRDELRLRVTYWRLGYRRADVVSSIIETKGGVAVRFDIAEGPPLTVETFTAVQTPPVLNEGQVRQAGELKSGAPVDLTVLDTAKVRLSIMLWDRGYADAVVRDSVQLIDSLRANVSLIIEPQPRTTIGTIAVSGNEDVTERTMLRLVDLHTGQLYRRRDLLAAQRRLYRSELFKQALITVPPRPDSVKDVVVTVREAPSDAVKLGTGFNTIEFVQGEAEWTRFNWIGTARRLDMRGAIGNIMAHQLYGKSIFGSATPAGVGDDVDGSFLQPTWRLSVSVTQPWLFSTRNAVGVSLFAHRRSVPGVVIDRGYGASGSFTHQFAEQLPASLTYRFEQTRVEGGDLYFCVNFGVCELGTIATLRQSNRLSPLLLSAFADRADDPIAPRSGYTARVELEHASSATFSQYRYNRAGAEFAKYFPVGPATLAAHVRGGWIRAISSTANAIKVADSAAILLHPSKRFYAGGARSVRGYAENQLGPRVLTIDPANLLDPGAEDALPCTQATIADGSCDPDVASSGDFVPRPVGGNTLIEASVEYRRPITATLTAAVFVDAARVGAPSTQSLTTARTAVTPGFGIRYRSPIGPIRIDLGIRPQTREDLRVVTQVADSTGLRLVQLNSRMAYDPLETSGGSLRKLLARFQLHLAIGEAF